jgi:hypothetical protein
MRMLPSANPSLYQQRDPPVMTTCTHARCRNVRKPGRCPISARSCPALTMDATIGQPSGQRMPGRIRPDTVHSTRHATEPEATRTANGRTARQAFGHPRSPRPSRQPAGTPNPSSGPALRLGNQDRLGDGNTASATVTTSVTRQLLGIAPPFKPRLGALLSSDDFGSSVEPAAKLHPLWQGARRDRHKLEQARSAFDQGVVSELRAV